MKIRKATKKDITPCLKIQKLWKDRFYNKRDLEDSIKNKDAFFLVAVRDKKVVGYIMGFRSLVKRNEAFLQNTMVDPREERQGIGKSLVNSFCEYLKEKGVKEIYAELEKEHIPFYINSCKFKDRGKHILVVKELK